MLEKDTFQLRFDQFLGKIRTDDLSPEEITAQVETVRDKRHSAKTGMAKIMIHGC